MAKLEYIEYKNRLGRFQESLQALGLDGAIIYQATDLYYLTGTAQAGHFFVPAAGEPLLLAYRDYERAQEESAWQVRPLGSFKELPGLLRESGWASLRRLGLEMDVIPLNLFRRYEALLPGVQWADIGQILRRQRMVKTVAELEALRWSATRHAQVFHYIGNWIRPGMTELAIAAEFEGYARRLGHQGAKHFRGQEQGMGPGLVAAGANSARTSCFNLPLAGLGLSPLYPMGASQHVWEEGEPLLIDYAGVYGDYTVDQTRIYLGKEVPADLRRAQDVALEIAGRVAAAARPGVTAGELYDLAVTLAARAGLQEHFMGYGRQVTYIGHGVGLDLNEWPVLARGDRTVLAAGMAFALEPKFVFPGLGSVGVEDTYVVTAGGAEKLTY
ncbi:M24 family metallopeptidase [Moorella sp. Hama-1]|uniref:M24 family metallopeptidase n=1 Tax=Moorella sp. Hama-1 TaxID=2138101 RepID=UPI000D64BE8E|nr:Xaa-Pro peptidase family protein [Moorella sp. Hama-1]BCV22094.1 peptidase M24 [Moorella sp. Hama-1]